MPIPPMLLGALLCASQPAAQPKTDPAQLSGREYPVATAQRLRPAGDVVIFGGRPIDLVLSPDGRTLFLKDNRGVVEIDTATWRVRQELPFASGGGSMHGIAVTPDGTRLFATTAQNRLAEAGVSEDGRLHWKRSIPLPGPKGAGDSHACGIALSSDGSTAYVCLSRNNTLGVVDLKEGKLVREIPVGVAPWGIALSPDGNSAWVSNWGGRRPGPDDKTAPSSGTPTMIDSRGVADSGSVSLVDLHAGQEIVQIAVDLHPSDLKLSADGRSLYVANANSDTVSVLDTAARALKETISVRPNPRLPFGSAPNGLALSRDGATLYVANGGNNAIAVVDIGRSEGQKSRVSGFVPTGWYPGAVIADDRALYIASVKGIGRQAKQPGKAGWNVLDHEGAAMRVPLPSEADLPRLTAQALQGARVPQILRLPQSGQVGRKPVPIPERPGEPSVFEHVVYVLKENRTYDQVFGDLPKGNNDPSLCLFGRNVTPNHHALAEQFVLLDNFYCNGVLSADGHSWATEGNVTDHLEKAFGGFTRSYTFGDDPLTYSSSGFLWDNAVAHGRTFRNYGEMDYAEPVPAADFKTIYRDYTEKTGRISFSQNIGLENLRQYSCREYPGWNLRIPDVLRADVFLKELKAAEANGSWPNLLLVYLPNDHTSGTSPGAPTPRAQVADNDLALGRIVEGISKSRFWPKTAIFVMEDDPQDGFDHVDGHRSPALVVSPYTRRGKVVSTFYNQTSVLHTMERILGLPPMNQMDALSPLMRACFQVKPDFRPYACLPNRVSLDEMNPAVSSLQGKARAMALKSAKLPLNHPDEANEETLNRILWIAMKGEKVPYPTRLAGRRGAEPDRD